MSVNIKKIQIPIGNTLKDVKSITDENGNLVYKGTWLYTIKLGNYVSKVKYSTNNTNWTSITSNTTVEVDSGKTLYIKAETYTNEARTYQYSYTMTNYNFDITRTEANDGGNVTVYRTATSSTNTYTLSSTYTNGSITYYKELAHTTVITSAKYGTTVYYVGSSDTGYTGTPSGSVVVNESNMTLNKTDLTATKSYGSATRITWSLAVTQSDYVTGWRYKINNGSWVNKEDSFTISDIDYDEKVLIEGVSNENDSAYTYGSYSGTGTFEYGDSATTISCSRTRRSYTLTFTDGDYGSWSSSSVTIYYGDIISRSGNKVYVYKWDATSTKRHTVTYTLNSDTAQYDYSNSYSSITSPATSDQTITSTDSRAIQTYTITFAKSGGEYGSWNYSSKTVQYGDVITKDGNTIKCKRNSTDIWTVTFTNSSDTTYNYSYSISDVTSPVTGSQTITATTSRSRKTYTLTVTPTYSQTIYVKRSAAVTDTGNEGTMLSTSYESVSNNSSSSFTVGKGDTVYYKGSQDSTERSFTMDGNKTITISRSTNSYTTDENTSYTLCTNTEITQQTYTIPGTPDLYPSSLAINCTPGDYDDWQSGNYTGTFTLWSQNEWYGAKCGYFVYVYGDENDEEYSDCYVAVAITAANKVTIKGRSNTSYSSAGNRPVYINSAVLTYTTTVTHYTYNYSWSIS